MVTWSAAHCGSSGSGRRTARKPQAVRTSWLPSCMWQVWQVGAAADAGQRCRSASSSARTPCLEAEYISHCGWSKPMWQVWQACGCAPPSTEKVWRVWQASQEAMPKPPAPLRAALRISASRLEADLVAAAAALHALGHGAMGCAWMVGMAFMRRPGQGVLALLELLHLVVVACRAGLGRGDRDLGDVRADGVLVAVADRAVDPVCAVLAELPVGDDAGCDACGGSRRRWTWRQPGQVPGLPRERRRTCPAPLPARPPRQGAQRLREASFA